MTRLAAWLALALLSAPTPQPLLARQSIRGGRLGCGRGVLLPHRLLTFQVGDLLFRIRRSAFRRQPAFCRAWLVPPAISRSRASDVQLHAPVAASLTAPI